MTTLPTGVVTFLFTDIEGSTRMLEDHRAAAGPALARHHDLLAGAVEAAGGAVFETVGDAVYAAFTRPADALAAAVAMHRAMAAEPWAEIGTMKIRIAVHSGAVETRGDHYFGSALFECARLQSLAHGGQTVTSAATAALAATDLPDAITLRPLGRHRLKDLATPMEVVQVDGAGLPTDFPPLRASEAVPNNLPSDPTTFIGRDADLARVAELIGEHRLVTLLGPGGTGKTRLAIEVAARQLDRFPDGVWLAELAPLVQPAQVAAEIADIWGLRAGEGSTLSEVLTRYLASRHLLLVVDNCEHVRETVAALLHDLLRAAPDVTIVATSRETLGIPGEASYRVPTLELPDDPAEAAECDAVRLFLDRVRSAQPAYVVSGEDMGAIVRVCRRLDGIPLGLELAAARTRTLSPVELADRLDSSLRILSSGAKTGTPRQRTLQSTLDWSHDMLDPAEQAVFRRVSVFAGGFDVAAAEAVCAGVPVEAWEVLDQLDSLIDKSLIVAMQGARSRFRLLEPIRQYAAEHLETAGETAATRLAHANHYAALAREAEPHLRSRGQLEWGRRLDNEHDNLRAALVALREAGELGTYLDLCFDLFQYWEHDGWHREGIEFLVAGLDALASTGAADAPDPAIVCRAWAEAAVLALDVTDPVAVDHAERGLAIAREHGDPRLIGRLALILGASIKNTTDREDADPYVIEGVALWEANPEPGWFDAAWERSWLGLLKGAFLPTEDPRRRAEFERAITGFREIGDPAMLALTLLITNYMTGLEDDAWILRNIEEAIEISRTSGYRQPLAHALYFWGTKQRLRGDAAAARPALEEGITILGDIGDGPCTTGATLQLIGVEAVTDHLDAASLRLGEIARTLASASEDTPPSFLTRVVDLACLVALESGDLEFAARLLGRSEQTPLWPSRAADVTTARTRLEAASEPGMLERLVGEGAAMTDREALDSVVAWVAATAA